MRIAILTPLFPPDIGDPAPYVKTLSEKLQTEGHSVSIFLYGNLPEKSGGARLIATDKRLWMMVRIHLYFLKLLFTQHTYDRLIINNGPSTELPSLSLALLRRKSSMLIISDPLAKAQANKGAYKTLHAFIKHLIPLTLDITNEKNHTVPEVHPFKTFSPEIQSAHEKWWQQHIETITNHEK